jgi:adenine specific DNA methylase Mod
MNCYFCNLNKDINIENKKQYDFDISKNYLIKGDIVLDFFSGSGTTAHACMQMNRRWIAVEQMDYIEDITKKRLKKVINGEQGGISKDLSWQGGGEFVYFDFNLL